MSEEKRMYTITKTCFEDGTQTYRSEQGYERLYDALHVIGMWSNMKTKADYEISVIYTDVCGSEQGFIAEKRTDNGWVKNSEEIILRQINVLTVKDTEGS